MDSLRISDAVIRRELWQSIRSSSSGVRTQAARRGPVRPTVAETRLLELVLTDKKFRSDVFSRLEADDYEGLATAPIFRSLIAADREGITPDYDYLINSLSGEVVAELLPGLLMSDSETSEEAGEEARQLAAERCLEALRLMKVDRRLGDLTSEIAAAERNGETELRDRLAIEHLELTRRRSNLLPKAEAMQTAS
jgi:predicted membrane chloride channel (bestrophin family)